mgnify:CR=1 FL=1
MQNKELTFIGHSLGGGEAAAASMATGRLAVTFNPATVSQKTIKKLSLNKDKAKIVNYITIGIPVTKPKGSNIYIGGDPLFNLQNNLGFTPYGINIGIPTNSRGWSHGIDNFMNKNLPDYYE